MAKLSSQRWVAQSPRTTTPEEGAGLNHNVLHVGVTVRGLLAEVPLTVREVLAMKPGDIITSGRPIGTPAVVELEGVPRFTASAGIVNRRKALRLLNTISKGEVPRDSALGSAKARIVNV
jgi:flagellar motor switch protein FliM